MSVELGDEFYYSVCYDDYERCGIEKSKYIKHHISDKSDICTYKVKLVKIENNKPNNKQLCYTLEILEDLTKEGDIMGSLKNKIGDCVYAWDYYQKCNLDKNKISINPQMGINDGGCLNCSGCYDSLLIPWSEYIEYANHNPVKIDNFYVKITLIDSYIDDMELVEEESEYCLYKKGECFGYLKEGEFCEVKKSDNMIACFFYKYLTLKEESEKWIRVNRDKNACMNILYLGKYFLENQSRPKEFQREKQKNENKKAIKLTIKVNRSTKNK